MEALNKKMPEILAIIPARGGSKGLKKKNVKILGGKPLIAWTIDEAKKSRFINRIVVTTEDEEIMTAGRNFGAEIVKRPVELAQDTSTTMDALFHCLEVLREESYVPDYVILLQCTSPLRTVQHIDSALEEITKNAESSDSLVSVSAVEHPPWWMKTIGEDGCLKDFIQYDKTQYTRRQDFPDVYQLNGAIYIAPVKKLYEHKTFLMKKVLPYVMESADSVDIDNEFDFQIAELLLKKRAIAD